MSVNVEVKRKIVVDGKEYESLQDVPPQVRTAIAKTLASGDRTTTTTIHINGKTYSSVEDLPAPLRAVVSGLTTFALNRAAGATRETSETSETSEAAGAVRPEPVLSLKAIVVAIVLAAALYELVRLAF